MSENNSDHVVSDDHGTPSDDQESTPGRKNRLLIALLAIGLLLVAAYGFTGLYVVQPIGVVPEGTTIWYWRAGSGLPFLSSPDSMAMTDDGRLSLLERGTAMAVFTETAEDRILARLPYVERLYLMTTDGRRWDL